MYSQYFKDLKKGEEWICCCFCCHGTVLLALCFPELHNKNKMQLLCRGKCGNSLKHLNTSWFLLLDVQQHALVLSILFPCLPGQGDTQHCQESLDRAGAMQKYSGFPTGVALTAGAVWRQTSSYRLYVLSSPCSPSGMGWNLFSWTHAMQGVKIRAGCSVFEF